MGQDSRKKGRQVIYMTQAGHSDPSMYIDIPIFIHVFNVCVYILDIYLTIYYHTCNKYSFEL